MLLPLLRDTGSPLALTAATALLVFIALALPATAQQTPNAAPGIRAEAIYDVNGVDNVALMNGALSIRIPLGLSYPVNGGFSYQLAFSHHSTLWDNRTDPCADPCLPQRCGRRGATLLDTGRRGAGRRGATLLDTGRPQRCHPPRHHFRRGA
ncbi:MAG: hypothetical protein MI919_30165, partial [Holophagales bacterium]|nr:hypothetical protein [Holophagales bacterium]